MAVAILLLLLFGPWGAEEPAPEPEPEPVATVTITKRPIEAADLAPSAPEVPEPEAAASEDGEPEAVADEGAVADAPPVEEPPAEAPPVEAPPIEAPPAEAQPEPVAAEPPPDPTPAAPPPTSSQDLVEAGWSAISSGQNSKARDLFRESVSTKPTDAASQFGLGYALERLGDSETAVQHYCKAVQYSGGDVGTRREAEGRLRDLGRECT